MLALFVGSVAAPAARQAAALQSAISSGASTESASTTTLADRLRAFGPEGKHMNPDFTVSEDSSLPMLHVRDTMTYMSTGDVTSDTIVIFQHTTGEYSGVPGFFNAFNGWEPPFYAVQLDRPGDLTTAPVPCHSEGLNTVEPCAPLEVPNLADCTPAHIETLRWFNDAIMFLAADYKNVILAGHSFGGSYFEETLRWRRRMGLEATQSQTFKLILISNPGADIWGAFPTEIGGLTNRTYNTVVNGLCGFGASVHNYSLPEAAQEESDLFEVEWQSSNNINMSAWTEEAVVYQLVMNYEPRRATDWDARSVLEGTAPMPAVVWTEYERNATDVPTMIVYSRTNVNVTNDPYVSDDGYYYSWLYLQAPVRHSCTISPACTLSYVDIDNWAADMMAFGTSEYPSAVSLWGHWLYVNEPIRFRDTVEQWVVEQTA